MDIMKLSNDGFSMLLFLFPGYLGFRVYFIDKSWNSLGAVHIFYGSLVFSVFSYIALILIYGVASKYGYAVDANNHFVMAFVSTPLAVVIALVWRRFGHKWFHGFLTWMRITNEDNESTPWAQIFNNPKVRLSQITVYLKDGSALRCEDLNEKDVPELKRVGLHAYYSSAEGDISFVADQYRASSSREWSYLPQIYLDGGWGVKMQWVPAREIARIEVRAASAAPEKWRLFRLAVTWCRSRLHGAAPGSGGGGGSASTD